MAKEKQLIWPLRDPETETPESQLQVAAEELSAALDANLRILQDLRLVNGLITPPGNMQRLIQAWGTLKGLMIDDYVKGSVIERVIQAFLRRNKADVQNVAAVAQYLNARFTDVREIDAILANAKRRIASEM